MLLRGNLWDLRRPGYTLTPLLQTKTKWEKYTLKYICYFLNSLELSFSISQKCKNCTGSLTSNWDGAKNEKKWALISPLEDEQKLRPEALKHQKVAPDLRIVTSTTSSTGVKILSLVKFHTRSDNRSNTIITLGKLNSFLNLKVKCWDLRIFWGKF